MHHPPATVLDVIATYPEPARNRFLQIRALVLKAAATLGVGPLQETLKWGEPAYLTSESKAGTTLRIAWKKSKPAQIGIYVNCQTNLVERFRDQFPGTFTFDGNRGLLMPCNEPLPDTALDAVIAATLTYHRNK